MGKCHTYSTKLKKNVMVSLHIYGSRGIFLLFKDDNDTVSE